MCGTNCAWSSMSWVIHTPSTCLTSSAITRSTKQSPKAVAEQPSGCSGTTSATPRSRSWPLIPLARPPETAESPVRSAAVSRGARCIHECLYGPLLDLSRVCVGQLQDVVEDQHGLGSDDEGKGFAQCVHRGGRQLFAGGGKRRLDQWHAAVLSPRKFVIVAPDLALQAVHQHHS